MQEMGPQGAGLVHPRNSTAFFVFGGACLLVAGLLLFQLGASPSLLGMMALVAAAIAVPIRWPLGALLVLFIASVASRANLEVGGWRARPEHAAVLLLLVAGGLRWGSGEGKRVAIGYADYFLAAYALWCYACSALMSPDPKLTLRWALLNNLAVLPYFLIRILVRDERILSWAFRAFVTTGVVECAYAVTCFASRHLVGSSFGVEIGQYAAGFEGVYGTLYEPNILGSYSASLAVMLLAIYFLSRKKARWLFWGTVASVAALLVSLSRAAAISFGVTSVILMIFGLRRGLLNGKKLLSVTLGLIILAMPFALTGGKDLMARFARLSDRGVEDDGEAMGRFVAWTVAIRDIGQHPVAGNGIASFQVLVDAKQFPALGYRPWVSNSVVRIVHDTGAIGLVLFLGIVVSVASMVRSALRERGPARNIVIALAAGCVVYSIAFMSTEGTMLAFFWVQVGLLASACSVACEHSRDERNCVPWSAQA